jgi:hypothetical protein
MFSEQVQVAVKSIEMPAQADLSRTPGLLFHNRFTAGKSAGAARNRIFEYAGRFPEIANFLLA